MLMNHIHTLMVKPILFRRDTLEKVNRYSYSQIVIIEMLCHNLYNKAELATYICSQLCIMFPLPLLLHLHNHLEH